MRVSLSSFRSLSGTRPCFNARRSAISLRSFSTSTTEPSSHLDEDSPSLEQSKMTGLDKKIHIMGMGNMGSFFAHALGSLPVRPPITLLLHHTGFYSSWKKRKGIIVRRNGLDEHRSGYNVNVLQDGVWYSPSEIVNSPKELVDEEEAQAQALDQPVQPADSEMIEHLILTVKTTQVMNALKSVAHRLTPDSTILFVHNGMGIVEEVNEKIFPDVKTRPNYMCGITSHGLYRTDPFHATHAGVGTTPISVIYSNQEQTAQDKELKRHIYAPSTNYLLNTVTHAPELTAMGVSRTDFIQFQLEKLAVNCVINPLTVLADCKNGELLYNFSLSRVQRLLLIEISAVICALPELQGVPGIQARFAPERLRTLAVGIANKTSENISSMLQDVRSAKETEIVYLNGYIVRRGEELGIKCALNYMILQLIQGKAKMVYKRAAGEIPLDVSNL